MWPSARATKRARSGSIAPGVKRPCGDGRDIEPHGDAGEERRLIDRYAPPLQRRWQEGCRTATILFQEMRAQGDGGSDTSCAAYLHQIHPARRATPSQTKRATPSALSPRQVVWLFRAPR